MIFCFSAKAQKDSTFARWSFGLNASADFDNYKFDSLDGTGMPSKWFHYEQMVDYSYGNIFEFHFNKKIFLKSGFSLSEKDLKKVFTIPSGSHEIPVNYINYRTLYVEIPLELGYNIHVWKKITLQTSEGMIFSFLTMNSAIMYYADNTTLYDYGAPANCTSTLVYVYGSFDLNYAISKKINIALGAYSKYNFTEITFPGVEKNLISYGSFLEIYTSL